MESWSIGVLEYCNKTAQYFTTPSLQYFSSSYFYARLPIKNKLLTLFSRLSYTRRQ